MNSLSWLIYLAGMVGSFTHFLIGVEMVTFILFISSFITWLFSRYATAECADNFANRHSSSQIEVDFYASTTEIALKVLKTAIILFVSTSLLDIVIPTRQTIILIAASEFGEKMINNKELTDKVSSVVDPSIELLQTYIKKETLDVKKQIESATAPPEQKAK